MTELQQFVSVAESLAKKAGDLCLELQGNLGDVKYKSAKDVVTIADVSSERLIVDGLREAFPTHSIRTEEAGVVEGSDPRYRWIIDPVDGTVNFSRGIPLWGISIALHFRKTARGRSELAEARRDVYGGEGRGSLHERTAHPRK